MLVYLRHMRFNVAPISAMPQKTKVIARLRQATSVAAYSCHGGVQLMLTPAAELTLGWYHCRPGASNVGVRERRLSCNF